MFHNCSLLKIKNGGDDWDRTNCDISRKIYSLLPYHYGGISKFGWPTWARTRDNLINSQVLYQLSYRPIKTMVSVGRIELPSHGPKPRILPLNYTELKIGGGDRDRTCDLLLAKQPLSQLSYTPILKHSCSPYLLGDQSRSYFLEPASSLECFNMVPKERLELSKFGF